MGVYKALDLMRLRFAVVLMDIGRRQVMGELPGKLPKWFRLEFLPLGYL